MADVKEWYVTGDEWNDLAELVAEIRGISDTETPDSLINIVAKGAAFHHAGFAAEHRTLMKDVFCDKSIKCTCTTPTFAAGVNTPSHRVVVRD